MRTHKIPGPNGMEALEAPHDPSKLFLIRGGTGGQCACGFIITGKTPEAVWAGMDDHQDPAVCAYARAMEAGEAD